MYVLVYHERCSVLADAGSHGVVQQLQLAPVYVALVEEHLPRVLLFRTVLQVLHELLGKVQGLLGVVAHLGEGVRCLRQVRGAMGVQVRLVLEVCGCQSSGVLVGLHEFVLERLIGQGDVGVYVRGGVRVKGLFELRMRFGEAEQFQVASAFDAFIALKGSVNCEFRLQASESLETIIVLIGRRRR